MAAPAPLPVRRTAPAIPVNNGSNRISAQLGATVTPGSQIGGDVAVGESIQVVLRILPGETKTVPISGLSYYFGFVGTTAGVPNNFSGLNVRTIQKGQPRSSVIHVQGTGLRFGSFTFSGLEIVNLDGANTVQITLVIGGGVPLNSYDEFIDKRVIVSGTSTVTISGNVNVITPAGTALAVNSKNAPTVSVGFTTRSGGWADSLAGGASQAVTDGYLGMQRKSIIFANDDAAAVLQVLDPTGNIVSTIQPMTAWTTDSGGQFTLKNPSAGAVTCHIGEIYYT